MGLDQGTIFLKHASPRVVSHVEASKSAAEEGKTLRPGDRFILLNLYKVTDLTSVPYFGVIEEAQVEILG
jgi:hypothetical protein